MTQTEFSTELFWQFSLAVYPQTKAICLHWQNSYGANVNLLLLLCYTEALGYTLPLAHINQLHQQIARFSQQITNPLRLVRQQLTKTKLSHEQQHKLKQSILTTELVAEEMEQQVLLQQLPELHRQPAMLPEQYLVLLNVEQTAALHKQILDLRQASQRYIASQP